MNNRKVILLENATPLDSNLKDWDVNREIGNVGNPEPLTILIPKDDTDNPLYNYWREQKIPWAHSRNALFEKAVELTSKLNGLDLDFGTLSGNCITLMANLLPNKIIYGFDSWKGYPADFGVQGKGAWAIPIPTNLPSNTKLIVGLFQDTLINFLKEKQQKINIIHIDCDLYDSTKYVFDNCYPYIQIGTVVQFNGLFNRNVLNHTLYWFNDELTAWNDFITEKNIKWEWIGSQGFSASMIIKEM